METPVTTKKSSKKAWIIIILISAVLGGVYYKRASLIPADRINSDTSAVVTSSVAAIDTTKKDSANATTATAIDTAK